jgi:rhodanese-related sulfurtransferase
MPRRDPGEPYYRISVSEALELYGDDDVVVVDVRRPDEYEAGHIKGAIFIPHEEVMARFGELPTDKKLLFICAQGVRSGVACEVAAAMGVDTESLYNIEAGTGAWIDKGHPTSYGSDA